MPIRFSTETPTAEQVRAARVRCGLSQARAASLCHRSGSAWQSAEIGRRRLDAAAWELFLLATNAHPAYVLLPRDGGQES